MSRVMLVLLVAATIVGLWSYFGMWQAARNPARGAFVRVVDTIVATPDQPAPSAADTSAAMDFAAVLVQCMSDWNECTSKRPAFRVFKVAFEAFERTGFTCRGQAPGAFPAVWRPGDEVRDAWCAALGPDEVTKLFAAARPPLQGGAPESR
jgi:hypothetical protein